MRKGLICSLPWLLLLLLPAWVRAESPSFMPGLDAPWQPPATDLDERPNKGPRGYPVYGCIDYLLWWTEKDHPLPALGAGASPANALLPATTDFGPLLRNGGRAVFGYWLDQQQQFALELGGFWLLNRDPRDLGIAANSGLAADISNRLWSGETQLRGEVYRDTWGHLDLLGGFRFLSLDEALHLGEINLGTAAFGDFGTHNRFYGGQLGTEVEVHRGKWSVDVWGKIALGANDETVHVNGAAWAAGQVQQGGVALHRDAFAALPETGINVGRELTNNIRVTVGYTFFYISDTARPGEQFLLPLRGGEFWGQGLNLGLEFRF
jgi:hypothetical protein